jgi:basic membrane lipoprotein Med (substrate-binding protein (PBP1-ABC) superfamily)
MTRRAGAMTALALLAAGCCGSRSVTAETTTVTRVASSSAFHVRLVGPLSLTLRGVQFTHGALRAGDERLVFVSSSVAQPGVVADAATASPSQHFVIVGASTKGLERPNLLGVVFRADQAAYLGGILLGLVGSDQGGDDVRIAWVGPGSAGALKAFKRGVHLADPAASVLHVESPPRPARCKEAALGVFLRGASAVMGGGGVCADAIEAAAAEQNKVAAALRDFELPNIAVAAVVRSALSGVYAGAEDLVFGFASGAIGVRRLDPRIPPDVAVSVRHAAERLSSGLPVTVNG